ncbi:hypothetical protein AB0P36_31630 [Streptomyces flavidovirens]|uniref:hypothetical protein n=1 Tax=Streptomyces flavidovirens TaxID=67298 RepID=UPI00343E1128
MTGVWLPLAATLLAAAVTYVCCIRPMRKNSGCCPTPPRRAAHSIDEEIKRTREELRQLREQATTRQQSER